VITATTRPTCLVEMPRWKASRMSSSTSSARRWNPFSISDKKLFCRVRAIFKRNSPNRVTKSRSQKRGARKERTMLPRACPD